MDAASITTATFMLSSGVVPVAGTVTYSGTTAVFRPAGPLSANTTYTVTVTRGARNPGGTSLVADFTWSFVTGAATDTTPPAVSSTRPLNGDIGVLTRIASAVFTESMDPATINTATFTLTQGGAAVTGTVSYSGTTAVFTPNSGLSASTNYTATITTGARDLAGNSLSTAVSWSFTTGMLVFSTSPRVVANFPASNATNIAVTATVSASFNKAMDPATIIATTFTLSSAAGAVPGSVALGSGGTIAVFSPTGQLAPNTAYTATVTTGAKDPGGIPLASNFTWTFTTGDTTSPTVVLTAPAANATLVARNAVISATFSELINPTTITATTFSVSSSAGPVAGTVTLNGTTAKFTPDVTLAPTTAYTATITSGVKDLNGNSLVGSFTWSFTTGAT